MRILLVNTQQKEHDNGERVLEFIKNSAEAKGIESELIWLGSEELAGCICCQKCNKTKKCIYDDAVNKVAKKSKEYDALILIGSSFYGNPSKQLISFVDRLFTSAPECFSTKPAALILMVRHEGEADFSHINQVLLSHNVMLVPSVYPMQISCQEEKSQKEKLALTTLTDNFVWLLECMKAATDAGIERPVPKERIKEYRIR